MRLYAIGIAERFIKFGVSAKPKNRMRTMQTHCPFPLILISESVSMDRSMAFMCERTIHSGLVDFSVNGEWFKWCPKTLALSEIIKVKSADKILEITRGWASQDVFLEAVKQGQMVKSRLLGSFKSKISNIFNDGP